jgi:predicted RND superfamily exporter protein
MSHFFEKRDPWGQGFALWIVLGMAFVLPIALWGVTRVELKNDVENWLSQETPQAQQFNWYQQNFQVEEGFVLTWEGSHIDDPRLEEFERRLQGTLGEDGIRRGGLKQIDRVRSPRDLVAQMAHYDVDREQALHRVQGVLTGPGRLRVRLTDFGQAQRDKTIRLLTEEAERKFGLKIEISEPFADNVPNDSLEEPELPATAVPAAESAPLVSSDEASPTEPGTQTETEALAPSPEPLVFPYDFQVSWPRMHAGQGNIAEFIAWARSLRGPSVGGHAAGETLIADCVLFSGSPAALAVTLSEAGAADRVGTFAAIRGIAKDLGIEESQLHMGGTPVAGAELNQEVIKSFWNRDFPLWKLHRRSVVGMSGLVGFLLAFWMLRSARLGALVLLISYFTTLVSLALVPATGGSMNMVLVVLPTFLLVVTISGAVHLANYWNHEAHRDPTRAIVRAVEMARMPCVLASVTTAIGLASLMTSQLAPVRDFGFYAALGTMLSLAAVLYGLPALLQVWPGSPPPEIGTDCRPWQRLGCWIVRRHGFVTVMSIVLSAVAIYGLTRFHTETKVIRYFADDARVVRDYNYLEENLAGIAPVETVIRFGPGVQEQLNFLDRMELVRAIQTKMRAIPDISGTLSLADFQPIAAPLGEDASFRSKLVRNTRAKAVEERVKHDANTNMLIAMAPKAGPFNDAGDELWRITAQVATLSKMDYAELTRQLDDICQSVTRYHPGTRHVVTGMVPLFLATQRAVLESLINSFVMAFGMIAVVMMILLGNPLAGLLAMLPNVLPVAVVFGIISWCGVAVDIGTMITASVGLGIAVDSTLHLLTWYRNALIDGATREEAVARALGHCGPAMWQTSLAVGLGLMVLCPADLLLISRFGWLMGALIGAALLGDIFLTPALLAGPLGRMIHKSIRASQPKIVASPLPLPSPHAGNAHSHTPATTGGMSRRVDHPESAKVSRDW